ncbi:MAG TPA: UDP-N-acetylmuramoyl-L-alanyl-D-glutamate--2,6-diaminopimelate ligase, partial [Pseudomonadales bacterium]|nr:UDP-N-acetylmuramoyl-L-alanyl-D-glutamate--2,6-diaminopimelate ligase [Pseudomonadales bacterium]
ADHCILTNDNPRTESPEAIVNDILRGLQNPSAVDVILDRKSAIEYAIRHAKPGDLVLLAGKGHETYQEVNHVRTPFSDVEVAQQVLAQYLVKLC